MWEVGSLRSSRSIVWELRSSTIGEEGAGKCRIAEATL